MKSLFILSAILVSGCAGTVQVPDDFVRQDIDTGSYTLACWIKSTDELKPIRIYLEGDGHAFNFEGRPTSDPTPKGTFLREVAFGDPNPNVIYLARPCQYVKNSCCTQKDWTTGRFSPAIVRSTAEAIRKLSKGRDTVLIGYSGGALLSGLVITGWPELRIKQWKTISGLLNHARWSQQSHLQPLKESLDLETMPNVPQEHYFGESDAVIDYRIYADLLDPKTCHVIPDAGHDTGFGAVLEEIYR